MIPQETISEIRQKSDIVKVVSEYVNLKKSGRNYVGLCPFHSEKGPSFTVSQEKQLFHCFGCGEGGNVFDFLMKIESIDFIAALAELGGRLGISVDKRGAPAGLKGDRDKLYDVMTLAARFFCQCFEAAGGEAARAYLAKRGITAATAKTFGLGFAPGAWDELFKHLISRGAAPALIERAGLTLPREGTDGYYDRFRQRLMFPVLDTRGRVIAFSGRALDNSEPKYMNSPETPLYRKGETIFGLNITRDEIKKERSALLVEGNVDLLAVYQAGCRNVAAPLGTALTVAQCKLLLRFSDNIVLVYDADPAGETAAERSAELLRSQGAKVKVAVIQGAKDPDELIRQAGADAFRQAIAAALPFTEYKIRRSLGRHNLLEIEGRSAALRETAALLGGEKDRFAQQEYARLAARLLNIDAETILAEIKRRAFYRQDAGRDLRRSTAKPASGLAEAEKYLLALAAQHETVLDKVKAALTVETFTLPEAKKVAAALFSADWQGGGDRSHLLLEKLADEPARNYLTGALLIVNPTAPDQVAEDCIRLIKTELTKGRVNELRGQLLAAEKSGETTKAAELLAALKGEIS